MSAKEGTTTGKRGRPRRGPDPERVQEIVDAAADIILTKGYSATSIQDIADAVGILKGSLYHYVRTKEDFLYRIIKDVYDEALTDIRRVTDMDATPLERLAAFIHAHITFAAKHLVAYTIQVREFDRLSPDRREEIRQGGETYVETLQRILEEGQQTGDVDPHLEPRLAAVVITGSLNSMTRWYQPEGSLAPEQLADVYSAFIISAVASSEATEQTGGVEKLRATFRRMTPGD